MMFKTNSTQPTTTSKFQKGIATYLTILVMAMLLGIGFGISTILFGQLSLLRGIGHSVISFYAADAGVEQALFIDQATCSSAPDRISCLQSQLPSLPRSLSNGATYQLTVAAGGTGSCPLGRTYCIKSLGTYQEALRAIRITR